mgnify:CR=1 FL=1
MDSVRKGVKGAMTLHTSSSTLNRQDRQVLVSSAPCEGAGNRRARRRRSQDINTGHKGLK